MAAPRCKRGRVKRALPTAACVTWSSPADGGVDGAQPLQDAVGVPWRQVRGQEGGAGQIRECAAADSRSVLAPIVARQESLQRGSAPYETEGFETKASHSTFSLRLCDHVTWVVREQEVGLHLET